jgi:hypothetical protein
MGQEQATLKLMIEGIRKNLGDNVLSDGCKVTADTGFSSDEFVVNVKEKVCVCPNGKQMLYVGDNFETASRPHMRFRGKLKDCRECPLQS